MRSMTIRDDDDGRRSMRTSSMTTAHAPAATRTLAQRFALVNAELANANVKLRKEANDALKRAQVAEASARGTKAACAALRLELAARRATEDRDRRDVDANEAHSNANTIDGLRARVKALEDIIDAMGESDEKPPRANAIDGRKDDARDARDARDAIATRDESDDAEAQAEAQAEARAVEILIALRDAEGDARRREREKNANKGERERKANIALEAMGVGDRALRARHALKAVNYTEPSLKVKLRRGDGECAANDALGKHGVSREKPTKSSSSAGTREWTTRIAAPAVVANDGNGELVDDAASSASANGERGNVSATNVDDLCAVFPERAKMVSPRDIIAALPASKPLVRRASPKREATPVAHRPARSVPKVNYVEPSLLCKMRRSD